MHPARAHVMGAQRAVGAVSTMLHGRAHVCRCLLYHSATALHAPSKTLPNLTDTWQGGKNRRRGKNENDNEKRELVFKEEGQEYAQVVKMLGNGRLEAQCFDGARRLAHIRGKLRKKVWINQGDIILLSLRDYQDEKGDVIMKYSGKSTTPQPSN